MVTEENARIAKLNADQQIEVNKVNSDLQAAYQTALNKASDEIKVISSEFEKTRQARIKEIAAMRIEVDPRFQETINKFLDKLNPEEVNA